MLRRHAVQVGSLLVAMLSLCACGAVGPSSQPPTPSATPVPVTSTPATPDATLPPTAPVAEATISVASAIPFGKPFATQLAGNIGADLPLEQWTQRVAWKAEVSFTYQSEPILLSGSPTGLTALEVDDAFRLTIRRPDGSTKSVYYDLSGECSQQLHPVGPFEMNGFFLPGLNRVQVELIDMCPTAWSTSGMWLLEYR